MLDQCDSWFRRMRQIITRISASSRIFTLLKTLLIWADEIETEWYIDRISVFQYSILEKFQIYRESQYVLVNFPTFPFNIRNIHVNGEQSAMIVRSIHDVNISQTGWYSTFNKAEFIRQKVSWRIVFDKSPKAKIRNARIVHSAIPTFLINFYMYISKHCHFYIHIESQIRYRTINSPIYLPSSDRKAFCV